MGVTGGLLIGLLVASSGWLHVSSEDGLPVRWERSSVAFVVHDELRPEWSQASVTMLLETAVAVWNDVACSGAAAVPPALSIAGWQRLAGADPDDRTNTLLWVHQGWSFGSKLLALTTLEYDSASGSLSDVDIAINVAGAPYDASQQCGADPLRHDLLSVLVHELGHALGLAHSQSRVATMFEAAHRGSCAKRTLSDDDREGLCALYRPPGSPPPTTDEPDAAAGQGCVAASGPSSRGPALVAVLAWLVVARLVRSRELDHLWR